MLRKTASQGYEEKNEMSANTLEPRPTELLSIHLTFDLHANAPKFMQNARPLISEPLFILIPKTYDLYTSITHLT